MDKISVLILEDEPLHAAKLEILLDEMNYHVLPIADNAKDALRTYHATQPDVFILDIQLNGEEDGIQFAEKLRELSATELPIIFLTSMDDAETYDRAKGTNPYAYLLKPVDRFSLQQAIELALQKTFADADSRTSKVLEGALQNGRNLFVKEKKMLYKVVVDDIQTIEVDGKYCKLYTASRNLLVRSSLRDLLAKLPADLFLQTHRNYLVNVNAISEIELDNGIIHTELREVPVSQNYKAVIMKNLTFLK